MSDAEASAGAPAPAPTRSAGALLRAAREKQGVHIAALAAAIKVTPRKLDALENDRWSELPDATFTRALAQTVCRALKVDPKPVLELMPAAEPAALDTVTGSLNTPFSERRSRDEPNWTALAIKPMVVAAGLLLLAALALWMLPPSLWMASLRPAATTVTAPASTTIVVPVVPAAPAVPAPLPAASAAASSAAVTMATATLPVSPAASAVSPAAPGAPVPSVTAPPAAAPAATLVQIRTTEASWVEVRDGAGRTLLSRTVQPGEAVGLDGDLPLRLVVGNAPVTQVSFRGQPVELPRRGTDTVSRLELK
jgi:cytoskeleton protein RodZ